MRSPETHALYKHNEMVLKYSGIDTTEWKSCKPVEPSRDGDKKLETGHNKRTGSSLAPWAGDWVLKSPQLLFSASTQLAELQTVVI